MSKNFSRSSVRTEKRGYDVIRDPMLNKGSGFSAAERDALDLHGILPPRQNSQDQQARRAYAGIAKMGEPLDKYVSCAALQDRNEHLFYRVLCDHIGELMPVVYTPTVGLATQNFSHVFQRGRGVWIDPSMRGRIADVLSAAVGERDIRLIVATDNESILGIGDQGAGGMAISVGKLSLYVAGAGIHPGTTLPISLDVGTNNEALLADELYLGWREPRLTGADYDTFIDEFVEAVKAACPNALLQWEDFRKDNALELMERHRGHVLSFNDDIQGTGAVALAGIFSALKILGESIAEQRILIHGAGAAGIGISRQVKAALRTAGVNEVERNVCILDSRGLLVDDQPMRDAYKVEMAWPAALATEFTLGDAGTRQLQDVVARYQPTIVVGASGQAGAFDQTLVETMLGYADRPVVLPFSNPTALTEARPADVIAWSNGRALVATGSPFDPVEHEGQTHRIGQGNNVFIFPGLGLGALLAGSTAVTDDMVTAASQACADAVTEAELSTHMLFPEVARLRDVTKGVARAVAAQAISDGLGTASLDDVDKALAEGLWSPDYRELEAG